MDMEHATEPYSAVFHFCDEHLLEAFLAKIPRSQLLEYVRANESLRNRHFPGFRLSSTVPTFRQILVAYRNEIVDRKNSKLANALCADWIRQQPLLASTALKYLGVQSANPADARSWIEEVQAQLRQPSCKDIVGKLVWTLAAQFSSEDIHIFVSIISYGVDQQCLRELIQYELAKSATDPANQKERIESDMQSARTKIENLEHLRAEVEVQLQSETAKAREVLEESVREDGVLVEALAEDDKTIQELTSRLDEIKSALLRSENARDARRKEKQKLSKAITRQRDDLSRTESTLEKRANEISDSIQQETSRMTELTKSLAQVAELMLAIQAKEKEVASTTSREPQIPGEKQTNLSSEPMAPTAPVTPEAVRPGESQNHISDFVGNNAVCYQGIQRTFRNAAVAFLRERLTQLFPADHIQRMKKTFGEEWDKAAQNASLSRDILGTRTIVRDEYDLLGTNHFYGLFERFYDKLFSTDAGQPANLPKPVKTRLLGNLKAIKDGRDPLSHPVEQEISFEEAHFLLYAAQEVLKWLGCSAQATELSALAAQLRDGEDKSTLVLRRVPSEDSIYLDFVGRNTLLQELMDCFANPDNKRCLLAGDGGKGKSAAAYRFVQCIPSLAKRFPLVVWLSAKTRKFRDRSTTSSESPDFSTAAEAIDRLLTEYGATAQDMEKSPADRKRLLFEYLDEFPAFIVADDIDTVLEDDEVVSLFTHEIPHTQSCVLITSRRAIPGLRSMIVPGFDPLEAEEFVKSRIRLYELNTALFTAAVIKEIAHITDGSPLYMDDLMRLAKIVDVKKAIKMWADKGGDEARKYALQREIEKLSQDARKILIAAAVTDDPVSFAELENVLELSEERLLAGLRPMQERNLRQPSS
jgi:predicted  nucleic acid-binding Zn-ribbon protein